MPKIPELLAPVGSYGALLAAIEAKADAVYIGGEFNARAFAENFDREKIKEAIELCHIYGIKAYVTLNTVVYERELWAWLEYAKYLWLSGADAFIVADLGAASLLKKHIDGVRLHASTQMTVHNSEGVKRLLELGFERVVVARELDRENIKSIIKNTGAEIEIFIHGALCVSVSGQCLFSSLVGGRSGNRGECAQPCRMLYNNKPLLSLKDNCLASHITEILPLGAASLKIEGRMKSPEYVFGTVSIYRKLLDNATNATKEEIEALENLFCRSGFTDGYFIGKLDGMLGVRTEADKKKTEKTEPFAALKRKVPVSMKCRVKSGEPVSVRVFDGTAEGLAKGSVPQNAQSAPLDKESIEKSLLKTGNTPYICKNLDISLDGGLYIRISELNALRREAILSFQKEKLKSCLSRKVLEANKDEFLKKQTQEHRDFGKSARFINAKQLSECGASYNDFKRIFLPLDEFYEGCGANGVALPAIVFDSEWDSFTEKLKRARGEGAEYALCSNISEIKAAKEIGYTVTADFRLNCTNTDTASVLCGLGADEIILSPELKAGGMRDIKAQKSIIVYGKIPVMLTQKCPVKEAGGCKTCKAKKPFYLYDRTGTGFAVFGECEGSHRATIYNSVPIYTADTQNRLSQIGDFSPHFIFSDENASEIKEVLYSYKNSKPTKKRFRRI